MENICQVEGCEVLITNTYGICPDCAADAADMADYLAEDEAN